MNPHLQELAIDPSLNDKRVAEAIKLTCTLLVKRAYSERKKRAIRSALQVNENVLELIPIVRAGKFTNAFVGTQSSVRATSLLKQLFHSFSNPVINEDVASQIVKQLDDKLPHDEFRAWLVDISKEIRSSLNANVCAALDQLGILVVRLSGRNNTEIIHLLMLIAPYIVPKPSVLCEKMKMMELPSGTRQAKKAIVKILQEIMNDAMKAAITKYNAYS